MALKSCGLTAILGSMMFAGLLGCNKPKTAAPPTSGEYVSSRLQSASKQEQPDAQSRPRFDATNAVGAVEEYIFQMRGDEFYRGIVARWWGGPPDGGKVTIRHRDVQGHDADLVFWAMRSQQSGPYAVYEQLPMNLDHPSVLGAAAQAFMEKAIGPDYNHFSCSTPWTLGDRFKDGQATTLGIGYCLGSPKTATDGSPLESKVTHAAECTFTKKAGIWRLTKVVLFKVKDVADGTTPDRTQLRTYEEAEINRIMP